MAHDGGSLPGEVVRRFRLLSPAERRRGLHLVTLGVGLTFLEWLGGASVFGFVALLARADEVAAHPTLAPVLGFFGGASPTSARTAVALAMGLFHLLRVATLLALTRARVRLRGEIGASLSGRLIEAHLDAPLSRHARRSSSELIRDVVEHAPAIWATLDSVVQLVMEVALIVGLLALLAAVRPVDTVLAAFAVGLFLYGTMRFTRRRIEENARLHRGGEARSLAALQQLYGGWKEVKVLGRERFFRDVFLEGRRAALDINVSAETLNAAPRALLEAAFVIGACVLALVSSGGTGRGADVFPILGLYAYTGFRAVPGVQRILGHLQGVRWTVAVTRDIAGDLERKCALADDAAGPPLPLARTLRLEGVTFAYPESAPVLRGIDLEVTRGSSLAIIGRTGAGKSTLLDVLLGLQPPAAGRVLVDGAPLDDALARAWRRGIGYVPQSVFLLDDTIRRNVAFGVADADIDDARVWRALRTAQAEAFVAGLPEGLGTVVGERGARLSGGERQRIAIARALYRDPEVLVLDEATAALDPATERDLAQAIEALAASKTLVFVTHRLSTARRCDRIVLLEDGAITASGPWQALWADDASFRAFARDDTDSAA